MFQAHLILPLALLFFSLLRAHEAGAMAAGELSTTATMHSIGMEWRISGDADHNALCTVRYRQAGSAAWNDAMPLFRVDFNGADMLAGSILFLNPGTGYEITLHLSDPDGFSSVKTLTAATSPLPAPPQGGRTLYVTPGSGGGAGSPADPFRGIASAQANAVPGDTFLLGQGSYPGETELNVPGTAERSIVWRALGDGPAILETVRIAADYVWIEGLAIQGSSYGIRTYNNPRGVVVHQNSFTGCHYCVYLNHGGTGWYIADNVIVGDVDPASGDFDGEGVELDHSDGHTVAHNSISRVADGVSYPGADCDIFGNDIYDVSDDGIEPDYGYANNRVWANRISNALHNGISFQPMNGAPWYILRNQVAAPVESALKFRDAVDRALIAHNTFVGWQGAQKAGSEYLVNVQSNNNLYISMTDWYAWENEAGGAPNWKTGLDYDGFAWGVHPYAVKWGERYADLADFTAATGLEPHGIRIDRNTCFASLAIPGPPPAPMPKQHITLKPTCNAVDSGVVLPNINDGYAGAAPDLGAYEIGRPLPTYGPRTASLPPGKGSLVPSLLPLLLSD